MTGLTPKGRIEFANDSVTADLINTEDSKTRTALEDVSAPIVGAVLAGDPSIAAGYIAASTEAVGELLADSGIARGVVQTSSRMISGGIDLDGRIFDDAIFDDAHFGDHMYAYAAAKLGYLALRSAGAVMGGMDVDGRLFDNVIALDGHFMQHTYDEIKRRIGGGSSFPAYAQPNIVTFGDSLTESIGTDWPTALGATLGTSVINQGISGQRAEHIAVRQGGLRLTFDFAGNLIPAALGEVALTINDALNGRSFGIGSNDYAFWGYALGITGERVYGRVTQHTGTGAWGFSRTTAGTAVTMPKGAAFIVNTSEAYRDSIQIIHAGRNNMYELPVSFQNVANDVRRMVGRIPHDRYLIPTITYRIEEYNGSTTGSARHDIIKAHNAQLIATYGNAETSATGHVVDLCGWLQNRALDALGWTATDDDKTDIRNDTIPRQLHVDETHFKPPVYLAWANWYASIITAKGWLTNGN